MSKKASPTMIGMFVLIGLALAVVGILLFSSSRLFTQTHMFILYFHGSVKGLNPGSAVTVQGVKVGTVKDVLIHFNQGEAEGYMPVIIEIDEKLLDAKSDSKLALDDPSEIVRLVELGLRARLEAESLVTGLLYVDLSVMNDAPPPVYHQEHPLYTEIPTVQNDIQMLMDNLGRFDIAGLSDKLDSVLAKLDENLGQLALGEISSGMTNLLVSLDRVATAPQLTNSLASAEQAMNELRELAEELRHQVEPLGSGASNVLAEAQHTLGEMRTAVGDVRGLIGPHAQLNNDLNATLEQLGQAAQAVADLADYLSRNPNALISGRQRNSLQP